MPPRWYELQISCLTSRRGGGWAARCIIRGVWTDDTREAGDNATRRRWKSILYIRPVVTSRIEREREISVGAERWFLGRNNKGVSRRMHRHACAPQLTSHEMAPSPDRRTKFDDFSIFSARFGRLMAISILVFSLVFFYFPVLFFESPAVEQYKRA